MALALVVIVALTLLQGQPTISQQNVPLGILRRNERTCPHDEDRERARNALSNYVQSYLHSLPINQSCGGSTGWTRIAYLNMTDPGQSCPSPWTEFTSGNKRVCFRSPSSVGSCDSVFYSFVVTVAYQQVCGRIIGYQYGQSHGFFYPYLTGQTIDTFYVDGISVTHGNSELPRQHIWTFAAGYSEIDSHGSCPCGSPMHVTNIPTYIGNNYFCETGNTGYFSAQLFDDPLWDGMGCGPGHSCECTLNSPPWFTAQLANPTTDDIEVRSCSYQQTGSENVGIELIELYVK